MTLSLVIPIYRDTSQLSTLLERLFHTPNLPPISNIVLVDDSDDLSCWATLKTLHTKHDNLTLVRLKHNLGQHDATWLGLQQATGNVIVTLDADLQHPPEEIPKLIDALHKGADLVFGTAIAGHPSAKRHGSNLFHFLISPLFQPNHVRPCSFRGLTRELLQRCIAAHPFYSSIDMPLQRHADKIAQATTQHAPSQTKGSTYSTWQRWRLAWHFIYRNGRFFAFTALIPGLLLLTGLMSLMQHHTSQGILLLLSGLGIGAVLSGLYHTQKKRVANLPSEIAEIIT